MTTGEFDITHWEKVGWENYGRWKQITAIADEHRATSLPTYELQTTLISDRAIGGFSAGVTKESEEVSAFINAVKTNVRLGQVLSILSEVQYAAFANPNALKDISLELDQPATVFTESISGERHNLSLMSFFTSVFPRLSYDLGAAVAQGKTEAVKEVLELFQTPEVPLLPYRKDLLPANITRTRTLTKGFMIHLPTRVPRVKAKFVYESDQDFPKSSLVLDSTNN